MKKCPFCKAEIEENARFCLYCMSSLQEKEIIKAKQENKKRWLYIIAAFLLLVMIFALTIFALSKNDVNNASDKTAMQSGVLSDGNFSNTGGASTDRFVNGGSEYDSFSNNADSSNYTSTKPSDSGNKTSAVSDSQSSGVTGTSSSKVPTASGSQPQQSNDSPSADSSNQTVSDTPTQNEVTYIYRTAEYGDDYYVSYKGSEDDIVITGVATASKNGVYVIPEKIDGKRVIAIMQLSFCGDGISDTVKKIVVPSTVKTIWDRAFVKCYNLTDIYFCGNSLYTYPSAFADPSERTGTLTIHCCAECSNRDFRYYKNIADSFYGAQFEEWNGGDIQ